MFRTVARAACRVGLRAAATSASQAPKISRHARMAIAAATAATAAAATITVSAAILSADAGDVSDPATGLLFAPGLAASRFGTPAETLLGTGCRYKYGYVKVYAIGLYVDPKGSKALAAVRQQQPCTEQSIAANAGFYQALAEEDSAATLILKLNREVDLATMVNALEEALKPRIESKSKASLGALEQFKGMLIGGGMGAGSNSQRAEFQFYRAPGNLLHLVVNGKPCGCVRDANLVWALFDVYLGANGVTPELRASLAKNIAALK